MKQLLTIRVTTLRSYLLRIFDTPAWIYIPVAFLSLLVMKYFSNLLTDFLGAGHIDKNQLNLPVHWINQIFQVVLAGPFFETFFFQAAPYYLLNFFAFFRKRKGLIILIPSLIFGLFHTYSLSYMVVTGFMGLVFMTTFMFRQRKGDAFACTFIIHALNNALVILAYHLSI